MLAAVFFRVVVEPVSGEGVALLVTAACLFAWNRWFAEATARLDREHALALAQLEDRDYKRANARLNALDDAVRELCEAVSKLEKRASGEKLGAAFGGRGG